MKAVARAFVAAVALLLVVTAPRVASAFCGFYVSGADTKLLAEATQVVLMREGTRTVLAMQNDYKGPPQGFAMVVPVPVVLQKENVKTLARDVFDRVDKLSAPRLVEYWEQDPCPKPPPEAPGGLGALSGMGKGGGMGAGMGFGSGAAPVVKIEAQFEVGEYEIVILSAQDSAGLDTWLRQNNYKIPENAEPALRPYVQAGSKFFVAKVNPAKVKFDGNGRATLSPLRFHYDSEKFELPVKLGLLNSAGAQDLVVNILSPNQRFQLANYPNVPIPTNLDVVDATRASFASFYATLFDRTLAKTPGAIVTEYAWPASSCDPCPGDVQGLSQSDLATLGADVLPSAKVGPPQVAGLPLGTSTLRMDPVNVMGKLPPEVVTRIMRQRFGAFRMCYERELAVNPTVQGKVVVRFEIDSTGAVKTMMDNGSDIKSQNVIQCVLAQVRRMSFPTPETPSAIVTATLRYSNAPPSPPPPRGGPVPPGLGGIGIGGGTGGSISLSTIASNFVLTRLHARYTKDALGNDLVFKAAPPIAGGRESFGPNGKLEQGAVSASVSTFQARYVIRHKWPGAITCKDPMRNVWGGPWPGIGGSSAPIAARNTAYAPRGRTNLAAFVPGGVPDVDVLPDPAAVVAVDATAALGATVIDAGPLDSGASDDAGLPDAGAAAPKPPSVQPPAGCGCEIAGRDAGTSLVFVGVGFAFVAILRRRSSGRA